MKKTLLLVTVTLMLFSCMKAGNQSVSQTAGSNGDAVTELPLPQVPSTITEPSERARYLLLHFWDALDVDNPAQTQNRQMLEQTFSTFVSIFPYTDDDGRQEAVNALLKKAEGNPDLFKDFAEIADIYLYQPESPVFSEDYYIIFLENIEESPAAGTALKARAADRLEIAQKNRPGMKAADFSFTTREGEATSLSKFNSTSDILLIFYDPDCQQCKEFMGPLKSDENLKNMISEGSLTVLAVYTGENRALWERTATDYPSEWTVGYEPGSIEDEDIYVFREFPAFYLLDREKRVIRKDMQPSEVASYISGQTQ